MDGQAGQLGHLPGLAVAPPGLQRLDSGEELLLLVGGGSTLQQAGGQGHAGALQQLAELAELPEVWACTEKETHTHTHVVGEHRLLPEGTSSPLLLTIGLEELVDVGQQLQQSVEVELGGAALQHSEEQHRGLALHPLQWKTTRGHRAATVPQLHRRSEERTLFIYLPL